MSYPPVIPVERYCEFPADILQDCPQNFLIVSEVIAGWWWTIRNSRVGFGMGGQLGEKSGKF